MSTIVTSSIDDLSKVIAAVENECYEISHDLSKTFPERIGRKYTALQFKNDTSDNLLVELCAASKARRQVWPMYLTTFIKTYHSPAVTPQEVFKRAIALEQTFF